MGNSFLTSIFKNTDLWSGAIDVRISTFLTQQEREREIKKSQSSILNSMVLTRI